MKKLLLISSLALATTAGAQFSSGTVNLGTTGMTVKLATTPTLVTITLTGSDAAYLGIGFGSSGMANGADGFIYNSTVNRDYTFGGIGITPTADAAQDWTQTSNTTSAGIRTVVATRSLSGGAGDTAIANASGTINVFFAKGTAVALSSGYHGAANRGYASVAMSPTLAVDELALVANKVTLYPNPVMDVLNFTNTEKIKYVRIFDASGKQLPAQKGVSNINVSILNKGVYFVEIEKIDGTTAYEKFIKN